MKRILSFDKAKVKTGVRGLGSRVKGKTVPRSLSPDPQSLLAWYDTHRRILPWRALPGATPDPYHVWLSEIMLQQTTVAAVGPYFQKFIKRWPTIGHLAAAPPDQILQMWAGLGYYRRAHLLHECARRICSDYAGQFPQSEAELSKLPGFGPYTSAAVAAIAFDRRANVVDGNVERVIARLFAVRAPLPKAKKTIRGHAVTLLPSARHGDYAQALMDLGATICTPRNPKCGLCPWQKTCAARALGIQDKLPRRPRAKSRPVRRAIAFVLVDKKNRVLLQRRPKQGLLGGMMEVPSSPWREGAAPALKDVKIHAPAALRWRLVPGIVRHVFSHFELEIAVATGAAARPRRGQWAPIDRLEDEALPSVMRKILRHAFGAL